jgi:ubiquinone/menaquinone biosynthesis C-methylase UbiE
MSESRLDPDVVAYYAGGKEEARLLGRGQDAGRLERLRTEELLMRHLPPAPAVVADVGGGAGVYAFWLSEQGYEVHLVDPIETHIRQAQAEASRREMQLAGATVGDARELDLAAESVDAVLMLGPLYHLPEAADRAKALSEARRVLRDRGLLVAAAISRFASTIDGLFRGFLGEAGFEDVVVADLRDGRHSNPERRPGWFTTAYFHRPEELFAEVRTAGFRVESVVAVEGPGAFLSDLHEWLDDATRRERLLRALRRVEHEQTLIGASPHMLVVAEKR